MADAEAADYFLFSPAGGDEPPASWGGHTNGANNELCTPLPYGSRKLDCRVRKQQRRREAGSEASAAPRLLPRATARLCGITLRRAALARLSLRIREIKALLSIG